MVKLDDLLKALLKMALKYLQGNTTYLKQNYNTWETLYLQKIGESALNLYEVD